MDTSETYVKMCEKAEEIQAQASLCATPTDGEHIIYHFNEVYYIKDEYAHNVTKRNWRGNQVWLPRQEQLQAMIDGMPSAVLINIGEWGQTNEIGGIDNNSYEQLWLAFVQRELHNKVWTGEEWEEV